MSESMKLSKYLSQAGVASRRASEKLILSGAIQVNGQVEDNVGRRVTPGIDIVVYKDQQCQLQNNAYFLLNEPRGYTCTLKDKHAEKLAVDLLKDTDDQYLYSIGRLDKDSEGLILFTNDGELCNRLTHPRYQIPKVYLVDFIGEVRQDDLNQLISGVNEGGEKLTADACTIERTAKGFARVRIVLSEGKNREIRRMAKVLGYHVKRLRRVQFGPITLGKLEKGQSRALNEQEIRTLKELTGLT